MVSVLYCFFLQYGKRQIEVLASSKPVPGGGGAAALCGAIGTALGHMVGALTVGKKKYKDVEEQIRNMMERCTCLEQELLDIYTEKAGHVFRTVQLSLMGQ